MRKHGKGNGKHLATAEVSNLNGQTPANDTTALTADTNAQTDTASESAKRIAYYKAVAEAREILAQIDTAERGYFRLGQLAHERAEAADYGDRTLAKFADDVGVAKCTLDRYATVYKAWKDILAPGPKSPSYSVLRELAPHADDPECKKAILDDPNITKREARDLKRRIKGAEEEKAKEAQEAAETDEWHKHNKKWFKSLVVIANNATRAAQFVDECTTDEQQGRLLKAVDPLLLGTVRAGGNALRNLAGHLQALFEERDGLAAEASQLTGPTAASGQETAHIQAMGA